MAVKPDDKIRVINVGLTLSAHQNLKTLAAMRGLKMGDLLSEIIDDEARRVKLPK